MTGFQAWALLLTTSFNEIGFGCGKRIVSHILDVKPIFLSSNE